MDPITKIDFQILDFIQDNLKCIFLDKALPVITMLGDHGIFPIAVAIILLIFSKTRKIGFSMGISFICGGLVGNLFLKNVVARVRPYDVTNAEILVEKLSDFSFPSGHTLIAFETAFVLLLLLKGKYRPIAIGTTVLAAIIAFSRLYLYVHYPSDVIVGMILGSAFGIFGAKLGEYVFSKFAKNKSNDVQTDGEGRVEG